MTPHAEFGCDVWWGSTDLLRPHHLDLLDETERARYAGYRRGDDRDRFVLGVVLLRTAAAAVLDATPREVRIDRACRQCGQPHGKPRIPGYRLHVSVSHSSRVAAVVVTRVGPVGIDVERVTSIEYQRMLRYICPDREARWVHSTEDFFRCWTRKESVVKATGDGLAALRAVTLTPPDAPPRLLAYAGRPRIAATITDLTPPAGYRAALTVLTDRPLPVRERLATDLVASSDASARSSAYEGRQP
ncbi:4'-phosphopantetheinyl transferase superfamily protein [Micromonospora sp. HM5-17]|uniref:4'-phosphopantetheinyl transferase family protein n=1 Tax=Micromonospora sp. HM5-17 TaxID=2487710 RepID=UPI00131563A0|nr:4'-phosphopantetheinyl transferase superfamily protein [Micromonospora sp. HM5-17]